MRAVGAVNLSVFFFPFFSLSVETRETILEALGHDNRETTVYAVSLPQPETDEHRQATLWERNDGKKGEDTNFMLTEEEGTKNQTKNTHRKKKGQRKKKKNQRKDNRGLYCLS